MEIARDGQLGAFRHEGFWRPMDTLRDRNDLEGLWADAPRVKPPAPRKRSEPAETTGTTENAPKPPKPAKAPKAVKPAKTAKPPKSPKAPKAVPAE